jgi:hypothetical protein
MQSPVKWLILCRKDLLPEIIRKEQGAGNRVVPSKDTAGETARIGGVDSDTLTNTPASIQLSAGDSRC